MSLLDRLFPPDEHPGVGIFGRVFLAATDAKPQRSSWFGPASSWTQRKPQPTPPDAYAPKIVRHHEAWPHESWPGGGGQGGQRPYQPWPGGGGRRGR